MLVLLRFELEVDFNVIDMLNSKLAGTVHVQYVNVLNGAPGHSTAPFYAKPCHM